MIVGDQVVIRPLINEKAKYLQDTQNKYTFLVKRNSNKNQIRNCIEKYFNVKVVAVKTLVSQGKTVKVKRSVKKCSETKKAYVSLKENQKIELFKGV